MGNFIESLHQFLTTPPTAVLVLCLIVAALLLGYFGAPLFLWGIVALLVMLGLHAPFWSLGAVIAVVVVFSLPPIRQILFSSWIMSFMKGILPKISETERTALEAGVVWMEAELFSGRPNFKKLMSQPYPKLSADEKAFLDGPVEELCKMINEWHIYKTRDIPEPAYRFMKEKGFLGMIIPKEYGGLGFSAYAHSEVVMKISSRSVATAVTVMVPNSLGPAELLIHYGTDAQKKYWLPRLARGEDIPCFGLTEPQAGSDAGSIVSEGVLEKGKDGEIYVRLSWNKRWITLAAISSVIGLAFRLRDPENLLGRGPDLGITCGLIPAKTPGVVLGRRHDPLSIPFYNCPTQGKNVVLKANDAIIGGLERAGHGWQMLMESLAAGRGISLPAQSAAGVKLTTRAASAHATIRKQFGVSISKFEGVEEPLARIGATTYYVDAMRLYTLSALDQGVKPPIVTAMTKYLTTEQSRKCVTDGMDVMGGAGITLGPRNSLAIQYIGAPIGITVEGANILTRTLMIFGQGAMRAHPFAYKEINAVERGDLRGFDRAFWGHIGHIARNKCRSIVLSVTRARFASRGLGGPVGRYYQKLSWSSATFAFFADLAMGLLGGQLKFKEKITGRFADIMCWMYVATGVLRKWEAEGRQKSDLPFVRYSMALAFSEIQKGFDGILSNFDVPVLGWFFRRPLLFWSRLNTIASPPKDKIGHQVVTAMVSDDAVRERLTRGMFLPTDVTDAIGRLDHAFHIIKKSEAVEHKVRRAVHEKRIAKLKGAALIEEALAKGIITPEEKADLQKAEEARWDAIQVDDFSETEFHSHEVGRMPNSQGAASPNRELKSEGVS